MDPSPALAELTELAHRAFADRRSPITRPMPGLLLLRHDAPTTLEATLYEPVVCLILQGVKQTTLGDRTVRFGPGESLLVSHELPVVSRIVEATEERPYLAAVFDLDLSTLRSLYVGLAQTELDTAEARSMALHELDAGTVDALGRYLRFSEDPVDARVLGPLVQRELHYRLLRAPHGGMLRRLLSHDSHESRVHRAIRRIRSEFRERLSVGDLAASVGMSSSSFHAHFKAVTATTPLQYQKQLRLLEARRLLEVDGQRVSEAAWAVGYESPTQFSREFAREFGASPSQLLAARSSTATR